MMNPSQPIDLIILSNGPGEVTTWIPPVVRALRDRLGNDRELVRISVVLSPCPNASGREVQIVESYPEVDRVQGAEHFSKFLVWGKTAENWDWRERGVAIFLGGDQFFPVVIGKRLGYQTVIYAEWDARWHNLVDRFAVMNDRVMAKVKPQYADKFTVVGDLMVDNRIEAVKNDLQTLIGILPGSKAAKLGMGLPLMLAIAEYLQAAQPQLKFAIPVAPTIDIPTLASYADPARNPVIALVNGATATLESGDGGEGETRSHYYLQTAKGLRVELRTEHDWLVDCTLCLTTVGANTAELGGLGVPMIVLIALQQLDAMRAWDGALGILVNLPLLGSPIAKIVNTIAFRTLGSKKLAWPNIWANGEEIVPELVGYLDAKNVAEVALDYLEHPEKLAAMRSRLQQVRGEAGAGDKIATIVQSLIDR